MFIINQDDTRYRGEDDPGHESLYGDIARKGNGGRMMEIHPHVVSLVKEGMSSYSYHRLTISKEQFARSN